MGDLGERKGMEIENKEKLSVLLEYLENGEEDSFTRLNRLLKTLRNDNREACFSLLNCFYLNQNFVYQNLKESLKEENSIFNEYINVQILENAIYPKYGDYYDKEKRRKELLNMVQRIKPHLANEKYEQIYGMRNSSDKNDASDRSNNSLKDLNTEEIYGEEDLMYRQIPSFWKTDDVVGTFNPIYAAREKLMNDDVMNVIPTIDIFYNSSKLLSIQTIFEPVSHYIFLLRLLPHFCLPLYDSGILQFVCEDTYLNSKFKGLEISYRLLIHDILFYAFFSYLSDLPFWAKPPIELLRIYNYESLYSLNDWESVHTERLVFHNIKNILFHFSDTLNKIELLYPKDYYITVFPNIYYKNLIDFLDSEHFKLKKIVIVIKGKKHIDRNMINSFKMNLQNFKGMTMETVRKEVKEKISFNKFKIAENKKSTKQVIEAMKKCLIIDKMNTPEKNNEEGVISRNSDTQVAFATKEMDNTESPNENTCRNDNSFPSLKKIKNVTEKRESTYIMNEEVKEIYIHKEEDVSNEMNSDTALNKMKDDNIEIKKSVKDTNCEASKATDNSLDHIDLSNKYKMDTFLYSMYYNKKKEENLLFNHAEAEKLMETEKKEEEEEAEAEEAEKKKNKKEKDEINDSSSDSSFSEDDSDNENVDGFFKSKKLKSTVYDKRDFSISQMMSNIINYDKIIEYLYNEDQHLYDGNSKVKFYIKMLFFEKMYINLDNSEGVTNSNEPTDVRIAEVPMETRESGEVNNSVNASVRVTENADSSAGDNMTHEMNFPETTVPNRETDATDRLNITLNNFISDETSASISNLIRNFRLSLENNSFLSFNNVCVDTEEDTLTDQNSFNFDNVQDSLTHITFNFN